MHLPAVSSKLPSVSSFCLPSLRDENLLITFLLSASTELPIIATNNINRIFDISTNIYKLTDQWWVDDDLDSNSL